ncbi:MAG: hypothetical protein ACE5K4_01100 [Candidatus Hydrothermarchaeota archaeon]
MVSESQIDKMELTLKNIMESTKKLEDPLYMDEGWEFHLEETLIMTRSLLNMARNSNITESFVKNIAIVEYFLQMVEMNYKEGRTAMIMEMFSIIREELETGNNTLREFKEKISE